MDMRCNDYGYCTSDGVDVLSSKRADGCPMQTLLRALHGWKEQQQERQRMQQCLTAALQRWRQNILSRAFCCMKDHASFQLQARQVPSHPWADALY